MGVIIHLQKESLSTSFQKKQRDAGSGLDLCKQPRIGESKPQTSHICSSHFSRDAISNYLKVEMGIAKKMNMQENAVPTIYPLSSVSEA